MSPSPLSNATSEHNGHESVEDGFLSELLYVKLQGSKCFSYPSIVLFPVKQQTGCVSWIQTFFMALYVLGCSNQILVGIPYSLSTAGKETSSHPVVLQLA